MRNNTDYEILQNYYHLIMSLIKLSALERILKVMFPVPLKQLLTHHKLHVKCVFSLRHESYLNLTFI